MRQVKKFQFTVIAAAIASIPLGALAQQEDSALEKVTVTATKREAVLTDVSLGISALSAKSLESRGITSLEDLGAAAPGMDIVKTGPGENLLVSRGISTSQSMSIQSGPAVGVYIDEMPLAGLTSGVPDFGMWDVARVEMLRGPQGTLYGEGAMAGTIRIISNAPDTKKTSLRVQAGGASVDGGQTGHSLHGMLNLPLSQGVSALRLTASSVRDPAWIDAPELAKKDANTHQQDNAKLALRVTPTDKLRIDASLWHQSSSAVHGTNQTGPGVYSPTSLGVQAGVGVAPIANGQLNTDKRSSDSANLTVNYDFGSFSLVSATSHTKQDADFMADSRDTLPIALVYLGVPGPAVPYVLGGTELTNTRTRSLSMTSEELRFVSNGERSLNWSAGAYYKTLDRHVNNDWHILVPLVLGPADNSRVVSDTSSNSKAVFAEADWQASPTITLTGGLRAYNDSRSATADVKNFSFIFGVPVGVYNTKTSESQTTYNFIASWKPHSKLNVFARAASGFRSGGPNLWVQDPVNIPKEFKAEKIQSYELGVKSNPAAWLVANAYLYKNEWKDKQVNLSTPSGLYDYLSNAGAAQSQGAEFEFQIYPTSGLSLNAALTYTDAQITKALLDSAGRVKAPSGSALPYVAPWELKASADYHWPLAQGLSGSANLSYVYRDANYSEMPNSMATNNGSLTQFNLRAGVESTKKTWGIFGFVRNLTNSHSITTIQMAAGGGYGVRYPSYIQPRTIGIELQASY